MRTSIATAAAAVLVLASCGGFPDPERLPGRYESTNAPASLELHDRRWTLENGPLVESGRYAISGNRLALEITDVNAAAFDRFCRGRADVYEWRLEDGRLVLRSVGEVCDPVGQAVFTAGPWEWREGGG